MKGGRKENSNRGLSSDAQTEGQIFPRAKYMNTDLLSPNDFPRHAAAVTVCICKQYSSV